MVKELEGGKGGSGKGGKKKKTYQYRGRIFKGRDGKKKKIQYKGTLINNLTRVRGG